MLQQPLADARVLVTPHLGASAREVQAQVAVEVVRQIVSVLLWWTRLPYSTDTTKTLIAGHALEEHGTFSSVFDKQREQAYCLY